MSSDGKFFKVSGLKSDSGDEEFMYTVALDNFNITQQSKDSSSDDWITTLQVNNDASLWFETETEQGAANGAQPHLYGREGADESDIATLKTQIDSAVGREVYRDIPASEAGSLTGGVNRGIGIGFWMPSKSIYGLGERASKELELKTDSTLYELWAFDSPHMPDQDNGLYGTMPYVQGVDSSTAEALAWVNSAHTWCWLDDNTISGGSDIHIVSETGALEVFLFSSAVKTTDGSLNRNKRMS